MHNAEFERLGLNFVYVPWRIEPDRLAEAVRGLHAANVAGFNATIPHKEALVPLMDELSEEARLSGAVNTVKCDGLKLYGFNTDIGGWRSDIERDISLERATVCVLGAGGAARGICIACAQAGVPMVIVANRTKPRATELVRQLAAQFAGTHFRAVDLHSSDCKAAIQNCDIVVNSTSVGMKRDPGSPVPVEWLRSEHYVYDTIYAPVETELLTAARAKGCRTRNGFGMLARQGAESFEIWSGVRPDADRMEATLREITGSR